MTSNPAQKPGPNLTPHERQALALELLGSPDQTGKRHASPLVSREASAKLIAFGWYGGKFSHLNWLLPLLPVDGVQTYVEPFGGSAAVVLNRPPVSVEVYNDLDREVVNFFRVLRSQREDLQEAITLTPVSREEFAQALEPVTAETSELERARRFYIRARQSRSGLAQTATLGRWANCVHNSRRGVAASVSRWLGSVDRLSAVAERLLEVQIENRPALDVIRVYDREDTLFYVDPPYLHQTRGDTRNYGFEMSTDQHRHLAQLLHDVQGKVVVSGYRHEVMDQLYPAGKWRRVDAPEKRCHSSKAARTESVWMNFTHQGTDVADGGGQLRLHAADPRVQ